MTSQSEGPLDAAIEYIAGRVASGDVHTRAELERLKKRAATEFSLKRYVSNREVLAALPQSSKEPFLELLRVHSRRSASGIIVVTAFSEPYSCPHGTCVFCPGGPRFGTPQSYLPVSPGMKTALAVAFDPYKQVRHSLSKYMANGHETDKVETIIEGGTFIAVPRDYQESFVKGVFDGLNGEASSSLEEAQARNETAESRCVGLSLETKPDWCGPEEVDIMLDYGITRLEIGVQSLRNGTLLRSNRGHTVEDSAEAFQVARDVGLKITAHMMPGLPGATPEEDLQDLRRVFDDEEFRPDMTKLYPTLVVPGTARERMIAAGQYEPYDLDTVVELLSEMKRWVPPWHRIMRIQREIPEKEIAGGVKNGNLRQLVLLRAAEKGIACRCIRCREVALNSPLDFEDDEPRFRVERYRASGGLEYFGSYELARSGRIAGFVRMRLPSDRAHRAEARDAAIVRELRVYGMSVHLGGRQSSAWQHRGLGRKMLGAMEEEARDAGARRVLVTSAVGTRNYYRRLGYERQGPYMARALR